MTDRGDGTRARGLAPYAVVAALVTLAAAAWSRAHDLDLQYADARSHLTIARRLVDGPNQGMVQLGTVWLPLQHLLLAPLTLFGLGWADGWAGPVLSAACMAVEVVALWHIARALDRGAGLAGLLAVVLYLTNPTILYLHTSSFTEPVLYAAVLTATAGLVRWGTRDKAFSGGEMALYCGTPAALAVLSRYDGWAFAAVWAVAVALLAWRRWGSVRYAAKVTTCFAAPPLAAALWWLWFNWLHWGDPLEFQRGPYSAQAQQDLLSRRGELPDEGDLLRSVETFARASWDAMGWMLPLAALAGVVVVVVRARREPGARGALLRSLTFTLVLAVLPAAFYTWSLFGGQIALRFGGASGSTFNLRYGAAVLPGLAVLAGVALSTLGGTVAWRRWAAVALALVPLVALSIVPGWRDVGVVREGIEQRAAGEDQWAAAAWLRDHLDDRTLLIDDSVNPMLPAIGADLDRVVAPFSRGWSATLADPHGIAYIYVDTSNPDDAVQRAIARDPGVLDGFERVAAYGAVHVYRATSEGPS